MSLFYPPWAISLVDAQSYHDSQTYEYTAIKWLVEYRRSYGWDYHISNSVYLESLRTLVFIRFRFIVKIQCVPPLIQSKTAATTTPTNRKSVNNRLLLCLILFSNSNRTGRRNFFGFRALMLKYLLPQII